MKVNTGENEFPVADEKILEALDDKARTCTIMTRNGLRVPHRARSPFHRVQYHRLNAYKYSVGGYRRALQIQVLEIGVRARRVLCEQCAWPALRPSGDDSNLETYLDLLDATGSHPQSTWSNRATSAECKTHRPSSLNIVRSAATLRISRSAYAVRLQEDGTYVGIPQR
jgi:hypothetical protein